MEFLRASVENLILAGELHMERDQAFHKRHTPQILSSTRATCALMVKKAIQWVTFH